VRALFHEVRVPVLRAPLPLLTKHSNIVLRNRERIAESIAEMVQTKWLSSDSLQSVLEIHPPAQEILARFDSPERSGNWCAGRAGCCRLAPPDWISRMW
jgi:uncharacterized membrane-anchored protein YjiN (DUF445 family)